MPETTEAERLKECASGRHCYHRKPNEETPEFIVQRAMCCNCGAVRTMTIPKPTNTKRKTPVESYDEEAAKHGSFVPTEEILGPREVDEQRTRK